ncbi:MAG TPA: lipopolysaccharide heptosyltransferase II [Gemmatimonadaceae bacterium]|nr:lipopolysaccharide heptosyltransferase II [Gemmatimonadaceae bacterium]
MTPALVIQTSFLGDTILTTPLLAYLARGGEPVDVLVTPASAAVLANQPSVREVIVYDKRGRDRGMRGLLRLARMLRSRRYATAYLAQGSVRSGALALAARIPRRVGFATSAGRRFYTARIPAPEGEHHAARLLCLGMQGTSDLPTREALRPRLYPAAAERAAVDALFTGNGWDVASPFIALAPGSVWGTKKWPHYPALAQLLPEARLVVVGSAGDAPLARAVCEAAGDRVLDATGRLSLLTSAELIRRARALVTNDSSPLHLASAMATPTLAIFGPTVPAFGFGPLAPRSLTVGHPGLACRPCSRHGPMKCPLGHWRCMREITAEYVAAVLRQLLDAPAPALPPFPETSPLPPGL